MHITMYCPKCARYFCDEVLRWLFHGKQSLSDSEDLLIPFIITYRHLRREGRSLSSTISRLIRGATNQVREDLQHLSGSTEHQRGSIPLGCT
jgi:hypothetical protein